MSEATALKHKIGRERPGLKTADANAITVLVVDDNDALRYSIARALKEAGYKILEARTGTEAIARAAEMPTLITLDVNLPDMDGFQVCRRLKSSPETAHIPILHVSSTFTDAQSRVHGLQGGADAYLAEPIDRSELVATVAALLRLKNAESEARRQAEVAESARKELAQLNATLEDRIKERTSELNAANDSLRELSARLLQARDDEQRRIARELHDGVGQLVIAIKINNSAIARETAVLSAAAVTALQQNEAMLQELHQGIRTISHLLHPPLLDEVGLPVALQWYVEEFSKRSGISVTLDCPESLERTSSEIETAVFRVVQECLGNVHRHSASPTATVRFDVVDGKAHLEIRDEGAGIPEHRQREIKMHGRVGVGLRGIRERIAQLGGEMQIESSSKGTTIRAALPWQALAFSAAGQYA
ncbi:MAG TPA: response regulator [Candidatus Acidoferrales bacterium]|nr:response regulator [Candidatus Acidoferrales bacterium]